MAFNNTASFNAFPISFQGEDSQNLNTYALSQCIDFIIFLLTLENQEHIPVKEDIKKLFLHALWDAFDDNVPEQRKYHEALLNAIAFDWQIKAFEYASEIYGYSTDQTLEIKKNLIDEFYELHSHIGTPYAIVRALEIFLFTNITYNDTATPIVLRDGTWRRDGTVLRDGSVINGWAYHNVSATKPTGLSVSQAEVIAAAVCQGYQPVYTKVYNLTII